jgi:hypothetical protein
MSTPVPQSASAFALSTVRTGQPVSTGGLARLSEEGGFVVGHCVHKAGEAWLPARPAGRTVLEGLAHRVQLPWSRSAASCVVRLCVELHASNELGDSQTIALALPTGASVIDAGGMDGSTDIYNPPRGRTAPRELVALIDVSGCTVGALADVFELTVTPTAKGAGVKRAALVEVPLAAFEVGAGEPAIDGAAVRAGRLVVDTTMQQVFNVLDAGRANYRQHWCVSGLESDDATGASTTPHWSREASTSGPLDWLATSGSTDPAWYFVPRALYGSAVSGNWQARVRYRTSNATACQIVLAFEAGDITSGAWVGAGSGVVTSSIMLPGTSGSWAWVDQAAVIPVDGPLVRVSVDSAKGPGTGQLLSVGCVAIIEAEL